MALDSIEGSLKERGVRLTRQRQILLELIDKTGEHLDAERLYQMAKEQDPKLNRVTVYRTLKMLKAGGLVDELDLMHYGGDQHYYETRLKQEHAHVICLRCGKVEEFFGEPLQRLRQADREPLRLSGAAGAHRSRRLLRALPDAARARSGRGAQQTADGRAKRGCAQRPRAAAARRVSLTTPHVGGRRARVPGRDRPQRPPHAHIRSSPSRFASAGTPETT